MKIARIETIRVAEFDKVVWVQVHTDNGLVGLGETWYGPLTVEAAVHELFSFLIGRDPLDIERHWLDMFRLSDHWGYGGAETRALSAIDTALWDIAGQAAGQPIYKLLGGACRDRIRVYNTSGGLNFRNDPVPWVKELLDLGITAMKVDPFRHLSHATRGYYLPPDALDKAIEPIRKIREAVGDAMEIAIDGHAAWSLHNAIKIAHALEPYNIMWLEEMLSPLNVDAHLRLAQETAIPICVAERLISRYQFREYIEKGAAEIVMPDLIWTGGITETKRIAAMAELYQTPVCPHDCTGPVNVFACAHICMNAPNAMLMETTRVAYEGWYREVVTPVLNIQDGHLLAPEGAGLGARLRSEVRERPDVSIRVTDQPGEHHLEQIAKVDGKAWYDTRSH